MEELLLSNPIFGIMLYIMLMAMVFAIPSIIGFISMYSIRRWLKKTKLSIMAWSLILHSPIILIITLDFAKRATLNAWNTLYGYSWVQSLTISAFCLPFTITIWILGIVLMNKILPLFRRQEVDS